MTHVRRPLVTLAVTSIFVLGGTGVAAACGGAGKYPSDSPGTYPGDYPSDTSGTYPSDSSSATYPGETATYTVKRTVAKKAFKRHHRRHHFSY